ncbi:MAG: hypothetical protein KatS3mg014_1062 [Actinomycetota bacterium]|nr:MAG: hypothetical protein KatS3mg014_1062 [Actinomycetota bacterium]
MPRSRRLGVALIAVGAVGLLALSLVGTAAPWGVPRRVITYGPGWMGGMHRWMHGPGPGWVGWSAPSPSPGARELRVVAGEFSFSPSVIEAAAGETVNLVLVNEGQLPHDLTIPALGFSLSAAPGTSAEGSLTAPAPGTYPFSCSVPGHRAAGMVGTLVVT